MEDIKNKLSDEGCKAWLDEDHLTAGKYVRNEMTSGIDASACVVVFITREYIKKADGKGPKGNNDNCKLEFDYAVLHKKKMIAVVMEPEVIDMSSWTGAVGAQLGSQLYVNMSADRDEPFSSAIAQLSKAIRRLSEEEAVHRSYSDLYST